VVAQSTSPRALTGAGGVTESKAPSHGDPGAMVEGVAVPPVDEVQPPATMATMATGSAMATSDRRVRWTRPGDGVGRELAGALPGPVGSVTGS
jgi:hypothetical protein